MNFVVKKRHLIVDLAIAAAVFGLAVSLYQSRLNTQLFLFINQFGYGVNVARFWRFMTSLGDTAVAVLLLALLLPRSVKSFSAITLVLVIGGLLTHLIKNFFDYPRPLCLLGESVHVIGPPLYSHSFISGHTFTAFAVLAILVLTLQKKIAWTALMIAILVGFSRVMVGAHWPLDIIAGAVLGWLTGAWVVELNAGLPRKLNLPLAGAGAILVGIAVIYLALGKMRDDHWLVFLWQLLGVAGGVGVLTIYLLSADQLSRLLNRIAKPFLGLVLLALLIHKLDSQRLINTLLATHWQYFACACLLLMLKNLCSVLIWQKVTRLLGGKIAYIKALTLYAQGITANSLLPGGIVAGDVWRAIGLAKHAQAATCQITQPASQTDAPPNFDAADAAASVTLDRVSGFWSLSLVSLIAIVLFSIPLAAPLFMANTLFIGYWIVLVGVLLAPTALAFCHKPLQILSDLLQSRFHNRYILGMFSALLKVAANLRILIITAPYSVMAQIFAIGTFWFCLKAVGIELSLLLVAALCAAIFLSAIVPVAIGGFGAREAGAIVFLVPLGINAESAFAASVLFGLAATVQGILGIYFWVHRHDE